MFGFTIKTIKKAIVKKYDCFFVAFVFSSYGDGKILCGVDDELKNKSDVFKIEKN